MEDKKCFSCGKMESDVPVINLKYKQNELWICPQCIPNLIHNPDIVKESLSKAEESFNV